MINRFSIAKEFYSKYTEKHLVHMSRSMPDSNDHQWITLHDCEDYTAYLLKWPVGSKTTVHDHFNSHTAVSAHVHILEGCIKEEIWMPHKFAPLLTGQEVETTYLACERRAGSELTIGNYYIHRFTGSSTKPAVTLHLYIPMLRVMHTYESDGKTIRLTGEETWEREGECS